MKTINIRDLRGSSLVGNARRGDLVGITNYRQLIAVIVPVTPDWLEHLIEYNWSHVRQSILEGEQRITDGDPMVTLDGMLADADGDPGRNQPKQAQQKLDASAALGGAARHMPSAVAVLDQFRAAAGASRSGATGDVASVRTVRVGDLSAGLIEKAGDAGQTLALTHDRVLVGMVIPVTRGLVEFLVEQNMSRVLYNIGLGEKEISETAEPMTTLGEVARGDTRNDARARTRRSAAREDTAARKA